MRIDIRIEATDDSGQWEYTSHREDFEIRVPNEHVDELLDILGCTIKSKVDVIKLLLSIADKSAQ